MAVDVPKNWNACNGRSETQCPVEEAYWAYDSVHCECWHNDEPCCYCKAKPVSN